jgi:RNA polymerase sigma-70 factor (ECF subfamily)
MNDFEALYRRHAADVFRFALYLCGNHAEAEDIASETFVRVWRARDGLRVSTVKAYLFAIARNLYREGRRRHRRPEEVPAGLVDPNPGPAAQAEGRAELATVLRALQSLPEADRAALLMRGQDGMPYEEIAAALHLSVAAVKVKVHRGRLRLAALCGRESSP